MARDGKLGRGKTGAATRRSVVRERSGGVRTVSLSRVRDTWDHGAFRDYVVQSARNAGFTIDSAADLARATNNEITRAMLGKWFAGREQPSVASLRKLAPAIQAPLAELLVLAGRSDADELGTPAVPFVAPALDPLARELNDMLAEDSPVPADRRTKLREIVSRIMEEDRRYMRRRRRHSA